MAERRRNERKGVDHVRRVVARDGPDPIDQHVGERLRQQRMLRGLSQTRIGKAIGITFQQVQKYEKGHNRVGASNLYKLATFLGVEVSFFFRGLENAELQKQSTEKSLNSIVVNSLSDGPKASREVIQLANYYVRIPDPQIRRCILSLLKGLSKGAAKLTERRLL